MVWLQERYIWCAIAGTDQIFQVDIAKCRNVQGLRNAVARDSDIPVDDLDLWKVS